MDVDAIPVTVVTGFLGAGKTTLLDRWLRAYAPGEVAVIVNELGAVGVDGELLRGRVQALVEITGGCVCCTTHDELVRALGSLAAGVPKRIFVETSGAASPAGVVRALHLVAAVRLDGIVTAVDASASGPPAPAADLAAEQLGYADIVVLTRADEAPPGVLEQARQTTARANPAAVIAAGSAGVLQGYGGLDELLGARAAEPVRVLPAPSEHRGIEAFVLTLPGELDEDRFGDWVEASLGDVAGRLFRVKGILAISGVDARVIVQGVADRLEVTFGSPWGEELRTSRIVVIGFGLDGAALERGFVGCRASHE